MTYSSGYSSLDAIAINSQTGQMPKHEKVFYLESPVLRKWANPQAGCILTHTRITHATFHTNMTYAV